MGLRLHHSPLFTVYRAKHHKNLSYNLLLLSATVHCRLALCWLITDQLMHSRHTSHQATNILQCIHYRHAKSIPANI